MHCGLTPRYSRVSSTDGRSSHRKSEKRIDSPSKLSAPLDTLPDQRCRAKFIGQEGAQERTGATSNAAAKCRERDASQSSCLLKLRQRSANTGGSRNFIQSCRSFLNEPSKLALD